MVRGLIFQQKLVNRGLLWLHNSSYAVLSGISAPFGTLFPTKRQIIHAILTRAPLYYASCPAILVRLACVRHAASVRSEPESNSPVKLLIDPQFLAGRNFLWAHSNKLDVNYSLFSFQRATFFRHIKDRTPLTSPSRGAFDFLQHFDIVRYLELTTYPLPNGERAST